MAPRNSKGHNAAAEHETQDSPRDNSTPDYPMGKARGPEVDGSFPDLTSHYEGVNDPRQAQAAVEGGAAEDGDG